MYKINDKTVFVAGYKNGAIYNFDNKKVYSVNEETKNFLLRYIKTSKIDCSEEVEYLELLKSENLLGEYSNIEKFIPKKRVFNTFKTVWLEITQKCNCKCIHCYQGETHIGVDKSINLENWINVIEQLQKMNQKRVVVIGGEPCTCKNLLQILTSLINANITTTLFTNATIINEDVKKFMVHNKDLFELKVSLYGHNAELHDSITNVKGSFDKLVRNVKFFVENKIKVNIAVVILSKNEIYNDEIIAFAYEIGASYVSSDNIRHVYGGTQNEYIPITKEINRRVLRTSPKFIALEERFNDNNFYNSCWFEKIVVTETGDILPCTFQRDIIYGNILHNTLQEIIENDITKKNWELNFNLINQCCECEYRFACKDCRPLGYSKNGNLLDKNIRCKYNPRMGEWDNE